MKEIDAKIKNGTKEEKAKWEARKKELDKELGDLNDKIKSGVKDLKKDLKDLKEDIKKETKDIKENLKNN